MTDFERSMMQYHSVLQARFDAASDLWTYLPSYDYEAVETPDMSDIMYDAIDYIKKLRDRLKELEQFEFLDQLHNGEKS
jgi:hypothetical protein